MGEANSIMSAKCCGCCALALMAIACVLAAIAVSTDFWYTGIYKVHDTNSNTFYAASTMGLEKACYYPKTFTTDAKEPDGSTILETKDWKCDKWKDMSTGGFKDTSNCKKAVDASLGFGILGIIGTAPFAAICLLFYCCPGKNCCASMMHWIAIAIGLGVFVCFLISFGVTAGQCDEYAKKDAPTVVTLLIMASGILDSQDIYISWSAILIVLALVFSFIAPFVYWRFKCLSDAECAGECESQEPAKNPSGAQA